MEIDTVIEAALARAEQGTLQPTAFFAELSKLHPALFVFLFDEDTRLLTEDEHDYLLFLAMIILDVLQAAGYALSDAGMDDLAEAYESIWGMVESAALDGDHVSPEGHPVIALSDFLADACTPDEGENAHAVLSAPGAELAYCKCRALIDSITGYHQH